MSTNAYIYIKLRAEDQGKILDIRNERFDGVRPELPKGFDFGVFNQEIYTSIHLPYIRIYCHHDGYPNGLGVDLLENFNTYEKVLALILTGDTSGLSGNRTEAYACYEGFEGNMPDHFPNIKANNYPITYLFDEDEWLVAYDGEFISLSKFITLNKHENL